MAEHSAGSARKAARKAGVVNYSALLSSANGDHLMSHVSSLASRLAFGNVSSTPTKKTPSKKATASPRASKKSPFGDASQRANRTPSKGDSPKMKADGASKPYYDDRGDRLSSVSNLSGCSNVDITRLQGHPRFAELMSGCPEVAPMLERKIPVVGRFGQGKALAEQQALIAQLKGAVAQLVAKRDQLLEIVCTHEDVQWQSEEAFRLRLSDQEEAAEARYQKIIADRDAQSDRVRTLESELAACQVEAALLKKSAAEGTADMSKVHAAEQALEVSKRELRRREDEHEEAHARLGARQQHLAQREAGLDAREAALDSREQSLAQRSAREKERLDAEDARVSDRWRAVAAREEALALRDKETVHTCAWREHA